MGIVEQKTYKAGLKFTQYTVDQLLELLAILSDYLSASTKNILEKRLAQDIKKGEAVVFTYHGDIPIGKMKNELKKLNIASFAVDGTHQLIIREKDAVRAAELNKELLLSLSNYIHKADIVSFENAVAKHNSRNKEIFSFRDMDETFVETFNNKCNGIFSDKNKPYESKPITVGMGKNANDKYDASVLGKYVFTLAQNKNINGVCSYQRDVCRANLEAMVSVYGPNAANKAKEIQADKDFKLELLERIENNEQFFIVSSENKSAYIEITQNGFTAYNMTGQKQQTYEVSKDNPNFEADLERHLDLLYSKAIVTDITTLSKHFAGEEVDLEVNRPLRSAADNNRGLAEGRIVKKIDALVKDEMQTMEKIDSYDNEKKFTIYNKMAAGVLSAMASPEFDQMSVSDFKEATGITVEEEKLTNFKKYVHALEHDKPTSFRRGAYSKVSKIIEKQKVETHIARVTQRSIERE